MTEQARRLIFAVDGGGTGCRVRVSSADGQVLSEIEGGPANITSDRNGALANLRDAVDRAATKLGERAPSLEVAHLGLAGVISARDRNDVIAAMQFAVCTVSEDVATTVEGALDGNDGVVASVGTGSFVAMKKEDEVAKLGGWGLQLGDQASGAWLGRRALSETLLAKDGLRPKTRLSEALLERFDGSPTAVVHFAASANPEDYATFARDVIAFAKEADELALSLVTEGAGYLERCITTLDPSGTAPVCLCGGLGPHYAPFMTAELVARVVEPRGTALDGATKLAFALLRETSSEA